MRIAVQTDPKFCDVSSNLEAIRAGIAAADAELVLFTECAVSGYGFDSRQHAVEFAETVPGPATEEVAGLCGRTGSFVMFGLLERAGERLFNSAALVGPKGLVGVYRKTHLPFLGVDRFVDVGDRGLPVFDLPGIRLGMLICFDLSVPETARVLKLRGAQLICVLTNWPTAAEVSCVHSPPVRAQENHVYLAVADRVGEESGFRFRGQSRVVDFDGRTLVEAGTDEEVVRAEIDPAAADQSRVVNVPGSYELDRIATRRPEDYGPITDVSGAL